MKRSRCPQFLCPALIAWLVIMSGLRCAAQTQPPASAESNSNSAALGELQSQVRELKEMVLQLQQQTVASRTEITRLREELETRRNAGEASIVDEQSPAYTSSTTAQLAQRVDQLEGDQQLLSGKIDDQYQTKVESASKYRVRFSGIVLFNLFGNSGSVENQDVPTWANPPDPMGSTGSVGGTLRQTILGFEAFGPEVMGAHTSANVNFDFGGGFPSYERRRELRVGTLAHRRHSPGLEGHLRDRRAGCAVPVAPVPDIVCVTDCSSALLCRQSLVVDSAVASRAPVSRSPQIPK